MLNGEKLLACMETFAVGKKELQEIAAAFRYDMECALQGKEFSSLRLFPSFLPLPTGKEQGKYAALDFGGTSIKASLLELDGKGGCQVKKSCSRLLHDGEGYDYSGGETTAEELFDFLAAIIAELLEGNQQEQVLLGHTFSYAVEQKDCTDGRLLRWAKEIAVKGVEGELVNELLTKALRRAGYENVKPCVILNDTVAALLAAAYGQPETKIASIYATGFNICCFEPQPGEQPPQIINLEAGNFLKLAPNKYDNLVDEHSEQPGRQRLEKMVSGRYLGELYLEALTDILGFRPKRKISSEDLAAIIETGGQEILAAAAGQNLTAEEYDGLQKLAAAVVRRSARLVAASYAGVLWHLGGKGKVQPQNIAIDGSVYEKMPLIEVNLQMALKEILGEEAEGITLSLVKGGSAAGAAIAAAMTRAE